jgi:hypothetical protein
VKDFREYPTKGCSRFSAVDAHEICVEPVLRGWLNALWGVDRLLVAPGGPVFAVRSFQSASSSVGGWGIRCFRAGLCRELLAG